MGYGLSAGVGALVSSIGSGLNSAARYAGAGERANAASAHAQQVAANFNQASANNANAINQATLASQYGFNSGESNLANEFSSSMWDKAAAWNESMFERQMQFNAEQAQIQRDWLERMEGTKYQRAIKDMKTAGLNPVLAVTGGGVQVGGGGGGAASVSAPSMGSPTGQMASGGLLGANDASIGGYTGQMEYYAGLMGLLGNALNGLSSAFGAFGNMPAELLKSVSDLLGKTDVKGNPQAFNANDFKNLLPGTYEYNYKKKWSDYWDRTGTKKGK